MPSSVSLQNDWSTQLTAPGVPDGGLLAFLGSTEVASTSMANAALCNAEAGAFSGRTFRPFRARDGLSAFTELGGIQGSFAWYRPDGVLVATSADLSRTSGSSFVSPVIQQADLAYASSQTSYV